MGYFYAGFDYKNRKNGYFKIGETGGYLSSRLARIRYDDAFECLGYLKLIDETKSERLLVESYARVMMSKVDGLTHTQNDHFLYTITSVKEKYTQANGLATMALKYAIEMCEQIGVRYEIGTKKYKK